MIFPPPPGRLLRDAFGPTDSEKRDWQFRNSRLHEQLLDRVEGFGSALDYDRFGNPRVNASQAPPEAKFMNTDHAEIQVKNRYNAKAYPWLEAYEPEPDKWNVFRGGPLAPTPQQARGTFATYKHIDDVAKPSEEACPCAVRPERPAPSVMSLAVNPCACQQTGQSGSCSTSTALWNSQHMQPQPPSRSHHMNWTPPRPPASFTPFSGGRRYSGDDDADDMPMASIQIYVPVWGLCVAGVLAALLLGFAIFGIVKTVA